MKQAKLFARRESGATLIVALVLLVVVTLLGAAGIRGTSLEMKMVASARDRAMAFEAAEATLRRVEQNLIGAPLSITEIQSNFTKDCLSNNATEADGAPEKVVGCFKGTLDADDPYKTCQLFSDDETDFSGYWEDKTNYENNTMPITAADADEGDITTQYVVEFMCFTLKEKGLKGTIDDKEAGDEDLIYMPLYRVTAVAQGLGKRANVMAQSMVKVNVE